MAKRIFNIIIIIIVVISLISIPYNFIRWLRDRYYLKVDESNFSEINELFDDDEELPEVAEKIGFMGGLGDWYLIIQYKGGLENSTIYDDDENVKLRNYIIQNGYSEGDIARNELIVALIIIGIAIAYGVIKLITLIKKKNKSHANKTKCKFA